MSSSPQTYVGAVVKGVTLKNSGVDYDDIAHFFPDEDGPFQWLGDSDYIVPYEAREGYTTYVVDSYNDKYDVSCDEITKEDMTNCIMGFIGGFGKEYRELRKLFPDASIVFACVQYWG